MSNEPKDPAEIEDVNIAPLSDEDLDAVAGGADELDGCTGCSTTGCCSSGSGGGDEEVAAF